MMISYLGSSWCYDLSPSVKTAPNFHSMEMTNNRRKRCVNQKLLNLHVSF